MVALALPALGGCSQRLAVEGRGDRLYAEAQGAMESEGFRPVGRGSDLPGAKGSDPRQGRLQFLYYADNLAPTIVEIRIEPGANEMSRTVRVPAEAVVVAPSAGAAGEADAVRAGAVRGREGCGSGGCGSGCASGTTVCAVPAPPVLLAIDPAVTPVAAAPATPASPATATPTTRTALTSTAGAPASVARVEPVVSPNGAPLPYAPDLFGAHRVIVTAWSSLTYAPDPFIADLAVNVLRRAYLLSGNVR